MTTLFLSYDVIYNYLNWFVYLTVRFVQSSFSYLTWSYQLSSQLLYQSSFCCVCSLYVLLYSRLILFVIGVCMAESNL